MAPSEICRLLGEAKFKEMFTSLSAAAMKLSMTEARLPAVRAANQSSTRKRNEDWAQKLWATLQGPRPSPCKVFLFEWLRQTRPAMLAAFLDSLGIVHQKGLTDADFMKDEPDDKLLGAAQALLGNPSYDRREVAAYLLFLEDTNETGRFASLELGKLLLP